MTKRNRSSDDQQSPRKPGRPRKNPRGPKRDSKKRQRDEAAAAERVSAPATPAQRVLADNNVIWVRQTRQQYEQWQRDQQMADSPLLRELQKTGNVYALQAEDSAFYGTKLFAEAAAQTARIDKRDLTMQLHTAACIMNASMISNFQRRSMVYAELAALVNSMEGGSGYEEAQLARWGILAALYLGMEGGNHADAARHNMRLFGARSFTALLQGFGTSEAAAHLGEWTKNTTTNVLLKVKAAAFWLLEVQAGPVRIRAHCIKAGAFMMTQFRKRGASGWPAFRAQLLQHCQTKWGSAATLSYRQLQAAVLAVGGAEVAAANQEQQQLHEELQQACAANQRQRVLELQHDLDMLEVDACIGQELQELDALQQEQRQRVAQQQGLQHAARQEYDVRQLWHTARQQDLFPQPLPPRCDVHPLAAKGVSALRSRVAAAADAAKAEAAAAAAAAEAAQAVVAGEADALAGSEGAAADVQQASVAELPGGSQQALAAAAAGASPHGLPSALGGEQGLQQQQQQQPVQSVEQREQEQQEQEEVQQQPAADSGDSQVGSMH